MRAALGHSLRRQMTEARATPKGWAHPERRHCLTKVRPGPDAEDGRPLARPPAFEVLIRKRRPQDLRVSASPATGCHANGRIAPGR
jgi:hypothetical protein